MLFIRNWRLQITRLWSIHTALFWAAVCGLYAAWPAFQGLVPAWQFAVASVFMSMGIIGARLLKQPGTDKDMDAPK